MVSHRSIIGLTSRSKRLCFAGVYVLRAYFDFLRGVRGTSEVAPDSARAQPVTPGPLAPAPHPSAKSMRHRWVRECRESPLTRRRGAAILLCRTGARGLHRAALALATIRSRPMPGPTTHQRCVGQFYSGANAQRSSRATKRSRSGEKSSVTPPWPARCLDMITFLKATIAEWRNFRGPM